MPGFVDTAGASPTFTYAGSVSSDTPLLYYRLGDTSGTTATDSSGNALNGTYQTATTLGVAGAIVNDTDTAVSGNGAGDMVLGPAPASLPTGDKARTVELWEKYATAGEAVARSLFLWGGDADSARFGVTINSDGSLHFEGYGSGNANFAVPTPLNDGNWHDIAVVYTPSVTVGSVTTPGFLQAYEDGKSLGTVHHTLNTGTQYGLYLGHAYDSWSSFSGSLDEFAIYPTALTGTQIANHVIAAGPANPPSNLMASSDQAGNVTITWAPPSRNVSAPVIAYNLYRATTAAGPWDANHATPLATVNTGSALTYVDSSATLGTTYYYAVTDINFAGESSPAGPVSVTPATVPGAPTGVAASVDNAQSSVSFTAPASDGGSLISGYTVTAHPDGVSGTAQDRSASGSASPIVVTGLTNGTLYDISVVATNGVGSGPAGTTTVTPATVPGTPSNVAASVDNAQSSVSFMAPADGGSPISGYAVTAHPDGVSGTAQDRSVSGSASPIVVTGLTNGTLYDISVVATNGVGSGAAGTTTVTPATVPGTPSNVMASVDNAQSSVSFMAPADGGSPISGYAVTAHPDGVSGTAQDKSVSGSASPIVVTGLTNGTLYDVSVVATNGVGAGPAGTTTVTPATVPGAPTLTSVSPGDGQAQVSWTNATNDGGSTVIGYVVTAHAQGTTGATGDVVAKPTAGSPYTLTGLTNGTSYDVTVAETNARGTGAASAAMSVTPQAPSQSQPSPPPTQDQQTISNANTPVTSIQGSDSLTSSFSGSGSLTEGWYASQPSGTPPLSDGAGYFDLWVAPGSQLSTIQATLCPADPATGVSWYDPVRNAWRAVSGETFSNGCLKITVDSTSTPSVSDLTGTIFAITEPGYVAQTPTRVLDTRTGTGGKTGPLAAGQTYALTLGTVPATATVVVLNVTVVHPAGPGNLVVYPDGASRPGASTVNYLVGGDVANLTTVELPASRKIDLYSAGSASNVVIDVVGYFTATAGLHAQTPARAIDTRIGTGTTKATLAANTPDALTLAGSAGVPSGASAVLLNLTAVDPTGAGNLRIYPDGSALPNTSNINYVAGRAHAVFAIVNLPPDGKVDVYSAGSSVNVVVDVLGYLDSTTSISVQSPVRILDTRSGAGHIGPLTRLAAGTPYTVKVAGLGGVPANATSVTLSVTAIDPSSGAGNLSVYPGGGIAPTASTLNYQGVSDVANAAIVKLSSAGTIGLLSSGSPVDVALDVTGWTTG
ncbi:MAG TPA: fibronectin type III domain-containing protein [Mycobacteriales bacterium]|nr:fibronectin type III domain-containing protein [Mycobacteriales bacterium]